MALDWNKEVSLSTILGMVKKGKDSGAVSTDLPTKTTMNLYQTEKAATDLRKVILLGILGFVCLIAVVKFGVLDPLGELSQKQNHLAQQQAMLLEMSNPSSEYAQVAEAYAAYTAKFGTGSVDAITVLNMVQDKVMNQATVTGIVLADSTLTLTIQGASLETVGNLASELEKESIVLGTNVTTASTQKDKTKDTVATLVVTLVGPQEEGK